MLVPFWSYFGGRTLEDLTDVIGQAMVFLPLGALLAAHSWRQTFMGTILVGFGAGVLLESGQVFLPDRTADISDAISAAAGAGLGWCCGDGVNLPETRPWAWYGIESGIGPVARTEFGIMLK